MPLHYHRPFLKRMSVGGIEKYLLYTPVLRIKFAHFQCIRATAALLQPLTESKFDYQTFLYILPTGRHRKLVQAMHETVSKLRELHSQ